MPVRPVTELERSLLRALHDADRRWLDLEQLCWKVNEHPEPVKSALAQLRRRELVAHDPRHGEYALTGLGKAALEELDRAA